MKYSGSWKNLLRGPGIAVRSSSERITSSMASAIGRHESALCEVAEKLKSICETSAFSGSVSLISRSDAFARMLPSSHLLHLERKPGTDGTFPLPSRHSSRKTPFTDCGLRLLSWAHSPNGWLDARHT